MEMVLKKGASYSITVSSDAGKENLKFQEARDWQSTSVQETP